jgi:23S rRNA (guanine2535-N1)-methyltransferase
MEPKKVGGQYQFTSNVNYEDYSSGRVLYGATGATNFPVRLVSEIFQRSKYYLENQGRAGPYTIYDPFCGAGYSLTVLGFMHGEDIKHILASDVNDDILNVAEKNLSLLTEEGLDRRIQELKNLESNYGKESHREALVSAERLRSKLRPQGIASDFFRANILTDKLSSMKLDEVDLVIADLPYGKLSQWSGGAHGLSFAQQFLNSLHGQVRNECLISISFNKKQEVNFEGYRKIKSFKLGTRKILILQKEVPR